MIPGVAGEIKIDKFFLLCKNKGVQENLYSFSVLAIEAGLAATLPVEGFLPSNSQRERGWRLCT